MDDAQSPVGELEANYFQSPAFLVVPEEQQRLVRLLGWCCRADEVQLRMGDTV